MGGQWAVNGQASAAAIAVLPSQRSGGLVVASVALLCLDRVGARAGRAVTLVGLPPGVGLAQRGAHVHQDVPVE